MYIQKFNAHGGQMQGLNPRRIVSVFSIRISIGHSYNSVRDRVSRVRVNVRVRF